jgi:hypothetical protein
MPGWGQNCKVNPDPGQGAISDPFPLTSVLGIATIARLLYLTDFSGEINNVCRYRKRWQTV